MEEFLPVLVLLVAHTASKARAEVPTAPLLANKQTTEQDKNSKLTVGCIALSISLNVLLVIALIMVIIYFTLFIPFNPNLYQKIIKARKLHKDSSTTVGLFSPSSPVIDHVTNISQYINRLRNEIPQHFFGTKVVFGKHAFSKDGYLAGNDDDRISDIHDMFSDPSITFMMANRGGWGCNRIINRLNYDLIRQNPIVIMGYSDLTGCLNAIFFSTGLITFHGPMGVNTFTDPWKNRTNINTLYVQKLLYQNELVLYQNPTTDKIITIKSGKAKGRLIGGNLSVFVAMIGTNYLPPKSTFYLDWKDVILFFEDISESPQHIDKFLTQLQESNILDNVAGFVFGTCTQCGSFNDIVRVIKEKVTKCPTFASAMIGHDGQQFTLPIGGYAEIDADLGTIRLLEYALVD
jgi:muramoyltetrapeptide carboxypeptidase